MRPGPAGVRVAVLIGMETLKRLRLQNVLDPDNRIEFSRTEVRGSFPDPYCCIPCLVFGEKCLAAALPPVKAVASQIFLP